MATIGGSNIVRSGLVLNLDAASPRSYPGSGTTWVDVSGNNNNGTLTNGPTFSSANAGSINFNGTTQFTNFSNIFNFTSEPFSFSYWVNFNSLTTNQANQGPVVLWKGNFNQNGYYDQISNGGISFITNQSGANQVSFTANGVIIAGNWYNISYTRNGASIRIYLNGVDITQTAGTHINPTSTSNNFRIANYNSGFIYGNFKLSGLLIYNQALSATEVLQNYNSTKTRFGL